MKAKYFKFILPCLTSLLLAANFTVFASQGQGEFVPVTLCHATGSETNPYEEITVDNQGQLNGHQNHENDIIPAPEEGCPDEDEEEETSPSPSPSASPSPSPSASPSVDPSPSQSPSPSPSVSPQGGDPDPSPSPSPSVSPSPSPQAILGSITVCKVIIDENSNVTNGSTVPGFNFAISGINPAQNSGPAPAGTIGTSNFATPLTFNTDIFASVSGSDAQCQTYGNLPLGSYYWGQETVASGWKTPKYNDQFINAVVTTANFYGYDNNLFDGNAANDSSRNLDADGHIVLNPQRPARTLIVLNQYEAQGGKQDPSPSPSASPNSSPDPNPSSTPSPSTGSSSDPSPSPAAGGTGGQILATKTGPQVLASTGSKNELIVSLGIGYILLGLWQIKLALKRS